MTPTLTFSKVSKSLIFATLLFLPEITGKTVSVIGEEVNEVGENHDTTNNQLEGCSEWSPWTKCSCEKDAMQTRYQVCNYNQDGKDVEVKTTESRSGHCSPCNRMLVISGSQLHDFVTKTEIFDLTNPNYKCDLPYGNEAMSGGFGGLTKDGILICGGWDYSADKQSHECYHFVENQGFVRSTTSMALARDYAKGIVINGSLWVTGGTIDSVWNSTSSSEILTANKHSPSIDLPKEMFSHCVFKINATHAMITGGLQAMALKKRFNSTFYVNLITNEINQGPDMTVPRAFHGCSAFVHQGRKIAMVAGGSNDGLLDSVEFLDLENDHLWTMGPKMPKKVSGFPLVNTPDENEVMAIGGMIGAGIYEDQIQKLTCPTDNLGDCKWAKMDHKLDVARAAHTAFLIPDHIDICLDN